MDNVLVKFLPFECRLTLVTRRRRLTPLQSLHQWFTSSSSSRNSSTPTSNSNLQNAFEFESNSNPNQDRELLMLDFDSLTRTLKTYFDEYMEAEFENSLYAPFSYVSLTGMDRLRRLEDSAATASLVELQENSNPDTSLFQSDQHLDFQITPIKTSNLRPKQTRNLEVFNVSKRYDGVAVFTKDGDLPIPSANYFQSKQLQAHADEGETLLSMLQSSSQQTGLNNVASVTLSVDINNGLGNNHSGSGSNTGMPQGPTGATGTEYDLIIIVAVIVAGCSMILLAFALFLAFRRRASYTSGGGNARRMIQTKLTPRTETEGSPTSMESNVPPPPVRVMEVHHGEPDDNISDYTESVFSLPKQTRQKRIKESLVAHQQQQQNGYHPNGSSSKKHTRISSRFNPRYIISSKKSVDESEQSSREEELSLGFPISGTSEQMMDGLKKNKTQAQSQEQSSSPSLSNKKQCVEGEYECSGLYPADIIDDDITSSLSAYGKGIGIPRQQQTQDDGVSLSSAESYGFSLDGVGDQSTFANSTKYGY